MKSILRLLVLLFIPLFLLSLYSTSFAANKGLIDLISLDSIFKKTSVFFDLKSLLTFADISRSLAALSKGVSSGALGKTDYMPIKKIDDSVVRRDSVISDNLRMQYGYAASTGKLKPLVLFTKFEDAVSGAPEGPIDISRVKDSFKPGGLLDRYFNEISYGKLSIEAAISNSLYVLPKSLYSSSRQKNPIGDCEKFSDDEIASIINNSDVPGLNKNDLSSFGTLIIFYPNKRGGLNCPSLGGSMTPYTIILNEKSYHIPYLDMAYDSQPNSYNSKTYPGMMLYEDVLAHELIHTLGIGHASMINPDKDPFGAIAEGVGAFSNDNLAEYGNVLDIMGHGLYSMHPNGLFKYRLGWVSVNDNTLIEIKNPGSTRVRLYPLETTSSLPKVARIETQNVTLPHIYVENRKPTGFDSNLFGVNNPNSNIPNFGSSAGISRVGLLINLPTAGQAQTGGGDNSALIMPKDDYRTQYRAGIWDGTLYLPGIPKEFKYVYGPGDIFTNTKAGIRISNIALNGDGSMSFDVMKMAPSKQIKNAVSIKGDEVVIGAEEVIASNVNLNGLAYEIDWGDGTPPEMQNDAVFRHKYAEDGSYIFTITARLSGAVRYQNSYYLKVIDPKVYVSAASRDNNGGYDFTVLVNYALCGSSLNINFGDGNSKSEHLTCGVGEKYVENKKFNYTYGYNYGVYTFIATVGAVSGSKTVARNPIEPANVQVFRTEDNINLKWGGGVQDASLITQLMVVVGDSYYDLDNGYANQDEINRFFGKYPLPPYYVCTITLGKVIAGSSECVAETLTSEMNYKISPRDSAMDYHFYMRTVSKNKDTFSDWIKVDSRGLNDYTPGLEIFQLGKSPAITSAFIPVKFSVNRSKSDPTTQTIYIYITFPPMPELGYPSPGVGPLEIRLDSENGPSAQPANPKIVSNSGFIIPVTFKPDEQSKDVTFYVKFGSNFPPKLSSPTIAVSVNQGLTKVPESDSDNNYRIYPNVLKLSSSTFDYDLLANSITLKPKDQVIHGKIYISAKLKGSVSGNSNYTPVTVKSYPDMRITPYDPNIVVGDPSASNYGMCIGTIQALANPSPVDDGVNGCAVSITVSHLAKPGLYRVTMPTSGGGVNHDLSATIRILQ